MAIISDRIFIQYLLRLDIHRKVKEVTRLLFFISVPALKGCHFRGKYLVKHPTDSIDTMVFHYEKPPFLAGLENILGNFVKLGGEVFQGDNRKVHFAGNDA